MARIESPEAREIYAELNVSPAVLGMEDAAQVIKDININVLPSVERTVGMAIDQAAAPYDYPFTRDLLWEAYPAKTAEEISEKADELNAAVKDWVKFECVRRLLGRIVFRQQAGSSNPYEIRRQAAKDLAEENKELALNGVRYVSALTPSVQEETPSPQIAPSQSVRVRRVW